MRCDESGRRMKSGAPHPLDVAEAPLSPEAGREEVLRRLRFAASAGLDDLQAAALRRHCQGEPLGEIARALNVHRRRARAAIVLGADRLLEAERRAAAAVLPLVRNLVFVEGAVRLADGRWGEPSPPAIEMPDGTMRQPVPMASEPSGERMPAATMLTVEELVAPFERAVAAAV